MSVLSIRRIRSLLCFGGVLVLAVCILIFSSDVSGGIISGLQYASTLLIPSLLPFMIISSFIIRSGVSEILVKPFAPITRILFSLPGEAAAAIILSFVGGYPVGAKCVRLLYDRGKLSSSQAEQMMLFCVCSGPAFLITGIGAIMLKNTSAGIMLYVSQLISGVILGIITGKLCRQETDMNNNDREKSLKSALNNSEKDKDSGLIYSFVCSCSDGAWAIIQLTAMVAVFSSFYEVAEKLGISELWGSIIGFFGGERSVSDNAFLILWEVTEACHNICGTGGAIWLLAFAVGFGGLCVHFQIFSVLGDIRYSKLRFFVFRFVNAFLSSAILYIICQFYRPVSGVFALFDDTQAQISSTTYIGTAALIIMCIVFVRTFRLRSVKRGR